LRCLSHSGPAPGTEGPPHRRSGAGKHRFTPPPLLDADRSRP
jgi:hypothetical protein